MLKNGHLVEEEELKHNKGNIIPVRNEMASSKHDVIVIGAGLSGLSAATRLRTRCPDLDVLVLESGDRVGGRTYSVDITAPDGTKDVLDLGAHWVGSTQEEVFEVMKQYGVDYYEQNIDGEISSSFINTNFTIYSDRQKSGGRRGKAVNQRFLTGGLQCVEKYRALRAELRVSRRYARKSSLDALFPYLNHWNNYRHQSISG